MFQRYRCGPHGASASSTHQGLRHLPLTTVNPSRQRAESPRAPQGRTRYRGVCRGGYADISPRHDIRALDQSLPLKAMAPGLPESSACLPNVRARIAHQMLRCRQIADSGLKPWPRAPRRTHRQAQIDGARRPGHCLGAVSIGMSGDKNRKDQWIGPQFFLERRVRAPMSMQRPRTSYLSGTRAHLHD